MAYQLDVFADLPGGGVLTEELLDTLIADHEAKVVPALETLWSYYRNAMTPVGAAVGSRGGSSSGRRYRLSQERGLPPRLAGNARDVNLDDRAAGRREIVIENDIAWRIHTMVDFMFGHPMTIVSTARDPELRRRIERAVDSVWEASGGIALLHDMGLLAHVYGHVDLVVREGGEGGADESLDEAARRVRIEVVEPTRGIPLLHPGDYRVLDAYVIRSVREGHEVEHGGGGAGALQRLLGRGREAGAKRSLVTVTEVLSASHRQVYDDTGAGPRLVMEGRNEVCPGRVPVVHIQNISPPFSHAGLGEVEPLIPLQDELNTRLSDRASRVTMQSFRMFLAKGIDGFDKAPVGPGQVWSTDNLDARVEAFGGDAHAEGEDEHIEQVREGLDKASGVPPLASGVVRAKIGNLTSENALRVTLMGLLSKTARKRIGYGRGIAEVCRLVLMALDRAGVLPTDPADRGVRIEWPDPVRAARVGGIHRSAAPGFRRDSVLTVGHPDGESQNRSESAEIVYKLHRCRVSMTLVLHVMSSRPAIIDGSRSPWNRARA